MPEVDYSYRVRVGPYEWSGAKGDPAEYGPVDGLTITGKLAQDSDLWPAATDAVECRFQLIVESMDDVAGVTVGTVVRVEIKRPAGGAVREAFSGRVADYTATPHALGMLLTLNCLDYTADLRELTVGSEPWPVESVYSRIARIFALAGQTVGILSIPPGGSVFPINVPDVAARDIDAQNAWDLIQWYCQQWPVDYGYGPTSNFYQGYGRMNAAPQTDATTGELTGWLLVPRFERPAYTGPLMLQLVAGKWRAVVVDNAQTNVLDSSVVDVSATYAITKATATTRVVVTGELFTIGPATITADLGVKPVVSATIEGVELRDTGQAAKLAGMYLPGEVPVSRWVAESFLWHLELSAPGESMPSLGVVLTVGGIPTDQNPNQREWFAGQVAASTFTLADKRPTYEFQLRRPDWQAAVQANDISWDSVAAAGKTWDSLYPRDTWDDYRLVRGTNT